MAEKAKVIPAKTKHPAPVAHKVAPPTTPVPAPAPAVPSTPVEPTPAPAVPSTPVEPTPVPAVPSSPAVSPETTSTTPASLTLTSDPTFDYAIEIILLHEGGYNNVKGDHGGETNFGITKRMYPKLDIAKLTVDEAKAIYKRDYWDNQLYKHIKDLHVATKIFDMAVNMGPKQAHIITKRGLKATGHHIAEEEVFDLATIEAINAVNKEALLAAIRSEAAGFYRQLAAVQKHDVKFLPNWLKRAYG